MPNTLRPEPLNHTLVVAVICLCLSFLILGAVSCEAQERQQQHDNPVAILVTDLDTILRQHGQELPANGEPKVDDFAISCEAQERQPDTAFRVMRVAMLAGTSADAITTITGLRRGLREGNPMMRSVVESPVALVAVKAGSFVAMDYLLGKLAKRGNRKAALVTGFIVAGMYSTVAVHNARLQRRAQ